MARSISGTPGLSRRLNTPLLKHLCLSTFYAIEYHDHIRSPDRKDCRFADIQGKKLAFAPQTRCLRPPTTATGRRDLAAQFRHSEQQLLAWANLGRIHAHPPAGRAKTGLLRAAGVTDRSRVGAAHLPAADKHVKDINIRRKVVHVLPSEKSVEQSIQTARKCSRRLRIRALGWAKALLRRAHLFPDAELMAGTPPHAIRVGGAHPTIHARN